MPTPLIPRLSAISSQPSPFSITHRSAIYFGPTKVLYKLRPIGYLQTMNPSSEEIDVEPKYP